ncbi:MAG: hypothetical protein JXR70_13240 [Spirochaetales bacterium]|nr:hypothetical protein [Spirochaetales bacterium]
MGFVKNVLGFLGKFLLIFVIIIAVLAAGLTVYYFISHQNSADYLPDNFLFYCKVNSIGDIYENLIDLKAAEIAFSSSSDLKAIRKALLDFKSNEFSKNPFFKLLLKVKADILISSDNTPIMIFDPGFLSLATRLFPLANNFIRVKGFNLNIIQKGQLTIFDYPVDDKQHVFFSINNNLIMVSTKQEQVEACYSAKSSLGNIKSNNDLMALQQKLKTGGLAEIFVNTASIIESIAADNDELKEIFSEITFNGYSAFSFSISNEDIFLRAYTNFETTHSQLKDFLNYTPASLQVIPYLPDSTSIYTSVNFKSFKTLLEILLYFKEGPSGKTLKSINDSAQFLLGKSADELIFDWVGNEMGIFTMEGFQEPLIFIKISNAAKLDAALDAITQSIMLDGDSSLVLDDVRISRVKFPDMLKGLVDLFVKGIETPYYVKQGNYLFLSTNAESLAGLVNDYKSSRVIVRDEVYKKVTRDTPKNANIFMYYNLASSMPAMLRGNSLLNDILKLYERGVFSIFFKEQEIQISISAKGIAGNKTLAYPGFPKEVKEGIKSPVYIADVRGSGGAEFVYINKQNQLIVQDPASDEIFSAPVEDNSDIIIPSGKSPGIFVFAKSGMLYQFTGDAQSVDPFPIITNYKGSFSPVEYNRALVFFSETEKKLFFLTREGLENSYPFDFNSPLLTAPAFSSKYMAFYPKSFSGNVYLADLDGKLISGWPREGGGISYCSPFFIKNQPGKEQLVFLTQSGILNLWNLQGEEAPGFPLDLDGVYYADPWLISMKIDSSTGSTAQKGILVLSAEGSLSLISLEGEIVKQKSVLSGSSKKNRMLLFDFDGDGIEEIFIYGEKNQIFGLGRNLEPLPGFPVKGSMKPAFSDLNFDRKIEMVTGSFDNHIYAYTLDK